MLINWMQFETELCPFGWGDRHSTMHLKYQPSWWQVHESFKFAHREGWNSMQSLRKRCLWNIYPRRIGVQQRCKRCMMILRYKIPRMSLKWEVKFQLNTYIYPSRCYVLRFTKFISNFPNFLDLKSFHFHQLFSNTWVRMYKKNTALVRSKLEIWHSYKYFHQKLFGWVVG